MLNYYKSEIMNLIRSSLITVEKEFPDISLSIDNIENDIMEIIVRYKTNKQNEDTITTYVINISSISGKIGIIYGYSGLIILNNVNNLSGFLIQDIRHILCESSKET